MQTSDNLISELEKVEQQKKSGKVYVYLRHSGSTYVVNLNFLDGTLTSVQSQGKDLGGSLDMLTQGSLLKVLFIPVTGDPGKAGHPSPIGVSELIDLFRKIDDTSWTDAGEITETEHMAYLQEVATDILTDLIGDSGKDDIKIIARDISPHDRPREFLDACRDLVAQVVGDGVADQAFEKLYREELQ